MSEITAAELATRLRAVVAQSWPGLEKTSDLDASKRLEEGEGWNRKQELGHLLDSATNNRVRLVRGALEHGFSGPAYDRAAWVELGGYADAPWDQLRDAWAHANTQLARLIHIFGSETLSTYPGASIGV